MQLPEMPARLLYITDTYCIWCFGFGAALARLKGEMAGEIEIDVINGGMIPEDTALSAMFGRFPDPLGLHAHVTDMSGQAFGGSYLEEIRNHRMSRRILNSATPARAMHAIARLSGRDPLDVSGAIHRIYYGENRDLQDFESYRALTDLYGIDFAAFEALVRDEATLRAVDEERRFVQAAGISGFPALLLHTADDKWVLLARGFLPYEKLAIGVRDAIRTYAPVADEEGKVCALDGAGC